MEREIKKLEHQEPHCVIEKSEPCHIADMGKAHFTEPEPISCPYCHSKDVMKYGVRNSVQNYICSQCKRKFNIKGAPFHMWTPADQIGASLTMYYNGLSLSDVAEYLNETHDNPVNPSTVYRWLLKYTEQAINVFDKFTPKACDTWIADETAIKFQDKLYWIWDIICRDSRFLLASYLSPNRGTREARVLMELATKKANTIPKRVITDKLKAYIDGIELVFGAETKHIQSSPFSETDSTNIIERFQGTIKERTKVLWGFKTPETAKLILAGFVINYNFFRPHISLNGKTPAEAAKIKSPFRSWTELVKGSLA